MEEKIDIGRVVQRGFDALGRHLPAYLLLGILFSGLPSFIVQVAAVDYEIDIGSTWLVFMFGSLISWVGGSLLQGAVVRSTLRDLGGMTPQIGQSLLVAARAIIPLVVISILVALLCGIGFLLLIVPGIMVYVAFSVAVPVLIEEDAGVFGSLQRSRELTRGSRWRIFLLCLIFFILYLLISSLASAVAAALSDGIYLTAFIQAAFATISAVIIAGLLTSLYLELRTVREGATISDLAEVFA